MLQPAEFDQLIRLLRSASHALRSYQHGDASPELAEEIADAIDEFFEEHGPEGAS